ncbi:MAG: hypothetical protein HYV53_04330 [Parcubacteria group bacterium]|nr:hypothetical protein [Parcubacteria group bacterium]
MTHGTHCHCLMCTVGKKMGMISKEHDQEHKNNEEKKTDQTEGGGSCGCGCN